MSFPRYPKYKESGVEWLGQVPEHWEVSRLRFICEVNPRKSETSTLEADTIVSFLPMDAIGEDGSLNLEQEKTLGDVLTGYTYFREGDVTLAKITPCFENGKGAIMSGLTNGIGFGTTELIVARPQAQKTTARLLQYLFRSRVFRSLGEAHMYGAGGQKRVSDEFIREYRAGIPPLAEQTAIADFLDQETAKIDGLIAEQERLIELLKEKRQAVISHAVTKGLDPAVPMKDSGIEWLGQVPEHWEVIRLGGLFSETVEPGNNELPILSVSIHHGVSDREMNEEEMDRKVTRSEDRSKYIRVAPGDLVYNMMRAWQGGFGAVNVEGMVSPAYVVARPRKTIQTSFVENLLRTPSAVEEMRRYSKGITDFRLRLYWDEFKNIQIPFPPEPEVLAILRYIDQEITKFDDLKSEAQKAITLLQERRTALISAAVTGQIDVRGIQHQEAA